jgi:hypothetical protein
MVSRRRRTPSSGPTLDYRTLIEHAIEGVFRTTPDGRA